MAASITSGCIGGAPSSRREDTAPRAPGARGNLQFLLKRLGLADETVPAGRLEVGMSSGWANARRAAFAIGTAVALAGCAPDQTPGPLLGTWYSEDERFAGRTLEINPESIRFMQGQQELSAIQVRAVTQAGSGDGPIRFEIEGTDREGLETTLALDMQLRPTELLRMETQREPWRRTRSAAGSKPHLVPWKRPARAVDSGGEQ
jgi:hypothetical protein